MELDLKGTVLLETDKLILRRFVLSDAEDMFKNYGSDPEVSKFLSWNVHKNIEDSKNTINFFMEAYNRDSFHWAIILKENNELIGDIAVNHIDKKNHNCEIGYQLGSKFWGNGYATEALKKVIDFLLDECNFHLIECKYVVSNPASGRVMEKAGMRKDAVLPERRYNKFTNTYEDLIYYSIRR